MSKTNSEDSVMTHKLAKLVARAGYASRRDAERLIADGKVLVDGQCVTEVAARFGEDVQISVVGAAAIAPQPLRFWVYHKPRGQITSHRDPQGRPTVFAALPETLGRVVSVGRLDLDSEGLLLLTNEGGIAGILEKSQHPREYRVRAQGTLSADNIASLQQGLVVEGVMYAPITAKLEVQSGSNCWLNLVLREGKNREIRRVMQHLGLRVNRLIRVEFGGIKLGNLAQGKLRELSAAEIAQLLPNRRETR